ncbi:MAG: hypothetical protein QX198_17425 [Methylococcaceae bacterium]
MKHFPTLRIRRLTLQLKELSIGDAIALANMPEHLSEAECTAFLKAAIESVTSGSSNPSDWTVQERSLAVAHYLASVLEDGPDFSLGEGRYSDYLDGSVDMPMDVNHIPIGEIGGDQWEVHHLTGAMTESIERLLGEVIQIEPRLHWIIGSMAAQLRRVGEEITELTSDGLFDEWLLKRMNILIGFPESDFEQLMAAYLAGQEKLYHLFTLGFNDNGIIIMPKKGGAPGLPGARFPVRSCLSKLSLAMAGKPD